MADDIEKLEYLSLVAKVHQEICNHANINDRTIAEFVLALPRRIQVTGRVQTKIEGDGRWLLRLLCGEHRSSHSQHAPETQEKDACERRRSKRFWFWVE